MPNALTLHAYKDWQASCVLLMDSLNRYHAYDARRVYSAQELEFYDSLSFRYTKALETAFYFFRSFEGELTGSTSTFLRDQLLKMEKQDIVHDVDVWLLARALRNKITHAYDPEDLEKIFTDLVTYARHIIDASLRAQKYF